MYYDFYKKYVIDKNTFDLFLFLCIIFKKLSDVLVLFMKNCNLVDFIVIIVIISFIREERMDFFTKNKKIVLPVAVVLGVIIIGLTALTYQVSTNKIVSNTLVSDINLGGMTKDEALKKLKAQEKFNNISLYFGDNKWNIPQSDINLQIDFQKTVDNAYNINRSGGYFSNIFRTLGSVLGSKKQVPIVMNYDKEKVSSKLKEIKEKLDSPVKDATLTYKDEKTIIVPDEDGRDMQIKESLEKIDNNLKKDKFNVELVVKLEKSKFKAENLKGIDTLLGEFSTGYGGLPGRDYNISKSARDTSGIILKPGEEFSFNGITGDKTIANGYKYAPVIESGKLVMGCGGGVCQTSSTIFNAALLSGMEITTRRNHSIPSDYVKLGRDATVVDGNPGQDFKFKNPFKNSVYIKNYAQGGKLVSQIFGSSKDRQYISITTQVTGSFGGGSKTIQDPSLPPGARVVEKYARSGYSVITYRVYSDKNGKVLKTERIAVSSYPSQTGIVRVGAAKPKATAPATGVPARPNTPTRPSVPARPVAPAPKPAPAPLQQ